MRIALSVAFLALFAVAATACGQATAEEKPADGAAALEGGKPLPKGAMTIDFGWMGKQSIMCIGDSVERQIAFVDFSDAERKVLGSVTIDDKGVGTGKFTAPILSLKTGHVDRDVKLRNHNWLVAEKHPDLVLEATKMTRVKPTVWRIDGTWTMKGVTKPISFLANVRYVGEMKYVGKQVIRAKGGFRIHLKDYEILNPAVGSPAVSADWDIDVVLLGVIRGAK